MLYSVDNLAPIQGIRYHLRRMRRYVGGTLKQYSTVHYNSTVLYIATMQYCTILQTTIVPYCTLLHLLKLIMSTSWYWDIRFHSARFPGQIEELLSVS